MNDLNCNEFVELVTAFLDSALDADQEQRFVAHLAYCDGCDRYLEQFRTTISGLGELTPEALPDDMRSALLAAFRDRPET